MFWRHYRGRLKSWGVLLCVGARGAFAFALDLYALNVVAGWKEDAVLETERKASGTR